MITLTNSWNEVNYAIDYHEFAVGTKLCNIFNSGECVTVGGDKKINIKLQNHDSKVWIPSGNDATQLASE